ncbi:hypothetical protein MMC07_008884 [Pseudocyphellaria aurata]|nr:hypothetical protein [Pseudocyphellaria aurata]
MTVQPFYLYGGTKPFIPPPWVPTNDTLRGGSSTSTLTPSNTNKNGVLFAGHLDTQTLGGAGFAAQFSPTEGQRGTGNEDVGRWDLTGYEGMEVRVVVAGGKKKDDDQDGKVYTLVLKDASTSENDDYGRRVEDDGDDEPTDTTKPVSSLSWEARFTVTDRETETDTDGDVLKIWLPWNEFKATYRGRRVEDGGHWTGGWVARVGFMMRR